MTGPPEGGIEGWVDILRGEGRITTSDQEVLEAVHQRFPLEIIVHWGDNGAVIPSLTAPTRWAHSRPPIERARPG